MKKVPSIILIFLPIVAFFYCIFQFGVDFPFNDDVMVNSFVLIQQKLPFFEKISAFFRQYNEHRIVYTKLMMWLQYTLFGKINYKVLMYLGSLSLVGILLTYFRIFKSLSIGVFVPISLLIFLPVTYENQFWAMSSLQNYTVVLFMVLCVAAAARNAVYWTLIFFLLAVLTSSPGLILIPVCFIIFLIQHKKRETTIWLLGAAFITILYFTNYYRPVYALSKSEIWEKFTHSYSYVDALTLPMLIVKRDTFLPIKIIGILFGVFVYGSYFKMVINYFQAYKNSTLNSLKLFNFGVATFSILIIGLSIILRKEINTSRYLVYPIFLTISVFLFYILNYERDTQKKVVRIVTFTLILFSVATYFAFLPQFLWKKREVMVYGVNFKYNQRYFFFRSDTVRVFDDHATMSSPSLAKLNLFLPNGMHGFVAGHMQNFNDVMAVSLKESLIQYPEITNKFIRSLDSKIDSNYIKSTINPSSMLNLDFNTYNFLDPNYIYSNYQEQLFLIFISKKYKIVFPVHRETENLKTVIRTGKVVKNRGYEEKVHINYLPNDTFDVFLVSYNGIEITPVKSCGIAKLNIGLGFKPIP